MKKIIGASFAIFVAWSAMDFVIHGVLLKSTYEATASLWRPMAEMKRGVMSLVTFLVAFGLANLWARFVSEKNVGNGLRFGLLYGLIAGLGMGFGSYSYMPIPMSLAVAWFLGTVAESVVAGLLLGKIIQS